MKRLLVLLSSAAIAAGSIALATPASADTQVNLTARDGVVGVQQTLSATVTASGDPIGGGVGTVTFDANGQTIGTDSVGGPNGSTASVSWTPGAAGAINVTATFSGGGSDTTTANIAQVGTTASITVPGNATSKDTVALGEKIYRGGIADRAVPACAGCHSPNGAGIPSQYPRLSGQHAEYTETQLRHFRDGTRRNNAQMTGVAAKMNDREIKAVSDYIAGLR